MISDLPTRYDLKAKELDALMLWSGPLGDMAKAAIGFLTGFDLLVPVTEPLLTREEAANDEWVQQQVLVNLGMSEGYRFLPQRTEVTDDE